MKHLLRNAVLLVLVVQAGTALGQQYSFPTRRQMVANVCPHLKITSFSFTNVYERSMERFKTEYSWENIGEKEIVAFEIVVIKYDPFNRQLIGSRTIFPGHNSATYKALKPKESDSDGGYNLGSEDVYTAYAYIRSIRFSDDTIWNANPADIIASIKKQTPDILEPGPLVPEKKPPQGGG